MKKYISNSNTRILCGILAMATLGFGLQSATAAQPDTNAKVEQQIRFESAGEGSGQISITGTSSLHDWEVVGKDIQGTLALAPGASMQTLKDLKSALPLEAKVEVPSKSLESGNGVMDKKMFKALESNKYEKVLFVLDSLKVSEADSPASAADGTLNVEVKAKLTIAGETRWVAFPAEITWLPEQKSLVVAGKVDLRMTEYGIDPPRALFGTLKTGDEVTVSFSWTPQLK
jgi:hypothetical protein